MTGEFKRKILKENKTKIRNAKDAEEHFEESKWAALHSRTGIHYPKHPLNNSKKK